jgi:hypothetical protein
MAKFKVLKSGETDINSTDIWRFVIHSDYKNQKISDIYQKTLTLPAGSNWYPNGSYVQGTIVHGLGYSPAYYAEVYFNGKSYPVVGDASPQIPLVSTNPPNVVGAGFRIRTNDNSMTIDCWATGFGTTATSNTFTIRVRFVIDELV